MFKNIKFLELEGINFKQFKLENFRDAIFVSGDKAQFEELLDVVTDLLCNKGIDSNSELNGFGYMVEDIISILSSVVYD
jgi:hypothetical protein